MYKTLVINSDEWRTGLEGYGCLRWNYVEYVDIQHTRKEDEKRLSKMFNEVAKNGYKLLDGCIRRHSCYVDNVYSGLDSHHGVYRFIENPGGQEEYYVYLGPLMKIDEDEPTRGCKSMFGGIGCGSIKGIGCKKGSGSGCKKPWMGCGCGRVSGEDEQFVNFNENSKNEVKIQKLNEYFGLRQNPYSFENSFIFDTVRYEMGAEISEFVKDHYETIKATFDADVKALEDKGFHYERIIELPSDVTLSDGETKLFVVRAMLFSKSSTHAISMLDQSAIDSASEKYTINLSDFDLWYYPAVYGFFGWLRNLIFKLIPFLNKNKEGSVGDPTIEKKNKKIIEAQYDKDFNQQIDEQKKLDDLNKRINNGELPVMETIDIAAYHTVKYKCFITRFFKRLFNGIECAAESDAAIYFEVK